MQHNTFTSTMMQTSGSFKQQMQRDFSHFFEEYPDKGVVPKIIKQSFAKLEVGLSNMAEDIRFSGSTCTSVLIFGRKIYVANIGDSRVLLIKKGHDHSKKEDEDFEVKQLTKDHNLQDEYEKTRIQLSNGRIDHLRDKSG